MLSTESMAMREPGPNPRRGDKMDFDKNEFLLIVDSTNGFALWLIVDSTSGPALWSIMDFKEQIKINIEDSIAIDHLDEKWGIDKNILLNKLNAGTEKEFEKLWEQINDYWEKNDLETKNNG